ncbi:MAG: hypothetical protein J6A76_08425 [Oscillospiraceae bacterium]|nr:hypothetical protein [Oscillospiraceae bacterium]
MNRVKKLIAVILALMFAFCGCSREGFEDSLKKDKDSSAPQQQTSSQPQQEKHDSEDYIFDLDAGEMAEGNAFYYYALPRGENEEAEEAAAKISERIHSVVFSLINEIPNGRPVNNLTVADAITQNNGEIFSACYDISYRSEKGAEKEKYCFGFVFDSVTGKQKKLEDFIELDVITTLITDSQGSEISGKDEELVAKKRAYLSDQGAKKLKKRLTAEGGMDVLLDASFYIDGNEIVCVFAAPQDIGGVVEVSVKL